MLALTLIAAALGADDVGWYGVPMFDYTSDTGLGLGVTGGVTWYRGDAAPYKVALDLFAYGTTRRLQDHSAWLDIVDVGDRPLRLQLWLGYASTHIDNFCGTPGAADCAPTPPETIGDDGVSRYYQLRHTEGYGGLLALRGLDEGASPWSVIGGWSGAYYLPGVPSDLTPYPGSLYARDVSPEGERGMHSAPQVGVMFDTRDSELNPTRGIWADATLRAAVRATGSAWTHAGGALTARAYAPLGTDRLVSATRAAVDVTAGERATVELLQMGGAQRYVAFGGPEMGRGVRYGRYRGQVKALAQQELRGEAWRFEIWDAPGWIGGVAFADAGYVAAALDALDDAAAVYTAGGGLRIAWDDFILRADLGVSPVEGWAPWFYLDFDHVF